MNRTAHEDYAALRRRIERLEARAEIGELIARYCFAVDERDIDAIGECFTRGGGFRSYDGKMDATGRAAVPMPRWSAMGGRCWPRFATTTNIGSKRVDGDST